MSSQGNAARITLSPQQADFIRWAEKGTGSCVLEAVAGAGKTTTLLQAVARMQGQVAILAYNKKIADEIKGKLQKAGMGWQKAQAGTVHSFGFSAYRKAFPNVRVDTEGEKVPGLLEELFPGDNIALRFSKTITKLVGLAKQRAIGIVERIDSDAPFLDIIDHFDLLDEDEDESDEPVPLADIVRIARAVLKASNRRTDFIDFDDMVYLPVLLKLRFWRFDVVCVDEAQDTNPARRALVRALVKAGGRVVAVGDSRQAIYGFTGADSDSMDLIAKDFSAIRMPLTVTFRCPKAVVEFSRQWVSHITAADAAPQGEVTSIKEEDFLALPEFQPEWAILCRNTKPLVQMAFSLIRRWVPCKVEGRDIGANLRKLATRWKVKTIDALGDRLTTYLERETTKLLAKKQETKLQQIEDLVETLRVMMDQCQREQKQAVADVIAYIDELFADNVTGTLVLSTIHKSKGREWPTVYWLDRAGTCPSRYARQEWQKTQEANLQYVAATRAQERLVEIIAAPKQKAAAPAPAPAAASKEAVA